MSEGRKTLAMALGALPRASLRDLATNLLVDLNATLMSLGGEALDTSPEEVESVFAAFANAHGEIIPPLDEEDPAQDQLLAAMQEDGANDGDDCGAAASAGTEGRAPGRNSAKAFPPLPAPMLESSELGSLPLGPERPLFPPRKPGAGFGGGDTGPGVAVAMAALVEAVRTAAGPKQPATPPWRHGAPGPARRPRSRSRTRMLERMDHVGALIQALRYGECADAVPDLGEGWCDAAQLAQYLGTDVATLAPYLETVGSSGRRRFETRMVDGRLQWRAVRRAWRPIEEVLEGRQRRGNNARRHRPRGRRGQGGRRGAQDNEQDSD